MARGRMRVHQFVRPFLQNSGPFYKSVELFYKIEDVFNKISYSFLNKIFSKIMTFKQNSGSF